MNAPTDWHKLATMIAEADSSTSQIRALVVTNSRMVINDIVLPAFLKAIKVAKVSGARHLIELPYGSTIRFRAVTNFFDEDSLRGMEFDCIFFDPVWQGSAEQMERIRTMCRVKYAGR